MTRLILSLIIWHSRCTFFTIKSHLLNCTVLYSTGSLCTVFVTVDSFFLGTSKFIFFFYSYYHYLHHSGHYLSFFQPYSYHSYYWYSICYSFIWLVSLQLLYIWFVSLLWSLSSLWSLISLYSIMSSSLRYWLDNAHFHLITILSLLLWFYNAAVMIIINW